MRFSIPLLQRKSYRLHKARSKLRTENATLPCNTGSYFERPLGLIRVRIKWRKVGIINGFYLHGKPTLVNSNSEVTGAFSLQNKAKQQIAI